MTIANVEMAALWDGEEGDEWTENAERYDATDRWIWARFEKEVDVLPADDVLDVGCGTGKSTRATARRASAGQVVGVDLSSRMLDHARRKSAEEGLTNVEYLRADAQVHPFGPERFDIAISEFGAMFFADPGAAFANIGRSLKQGGRLALLSWQPFSENEWLTAVFGAVAGGRDLPSPPVGRPGPFGLADPDAVRALLGAAGYRDTAVTAVEEPMWVGADEADAFAFLSEMGLVRGFTEQLDAAARNDALDNLREVVAAHATDEGVVFGSAAWLVTARRA